MKQSLRAFALSFAIGVAVLALPAQAADPQVLGTYGAWRALTFDDKGSKGKVCFMSSRPEKEEGNYTRRGDVAFFVTHWAGEGTRDVVSVSIGYAFKTGSPLRVSIDGRDFTMATDGEMAWATDAATDKAISEAIRKGSRMVVRGTSQRGTLTTDTYSLKGSGDAYAAINKACGF